MASKTFAKDRKSSRSRPLGPEEVPAHAPRIAIVGRPNVGKSTLFNRLFGRRRALVHDMPGVTRDRLEEAVLWAVAGGEGIVRLIDTGGLGGEKFGQEIDRQVSTALEVADLVLFVADGEAGVQSEDEEIARRLQKSGLARKGVPIALVVNKTDDVRHEERAAEFYALGFDPVLSVSAEHGRGIDDLQRWVKEALGPKWCVPGATASSVSTVVEVTDADEEALAADSGEAAEPTEIDEEAPGEETEAQAAEFEAALKRPIRLAIVGRPNVGKSTMTNALIGEDRMITSPIAGTTVDSVDSLVELDGEPAVIIDTAGIRRKNKTEKGVEVLSVVQARKALERCDVAILVLDGEKGLIDQDEKIGGLIEEIGCGVILAMNKWDTQHANPEFTREEAAERIRKTMAFLRYAPVIFTSAKKRQGLRGLGELAREIMLQRRTKLTTKEFSEFVRRESPIHNPHGAKFYLCHQAGRNPPTFVCHVNDPNRVHFSLRRHLVNAMREKWGFMGSPVRLLFVKGKSAPGRESAPSKSRGRK
jgi:GTP-binding protein